MIYFAVEYLDSNGANAAKLYIILNIKPGNVLPSSKGIPEVQLTGNI